MIIPLVVSSIAVLVTLGYSSVLDIRDRRVPFPTWYPLLAVGIPMAIWFYFSLFLESGPAPVLYFLVLTGLFSVIFYSFAYFGLFGGADAWALIFLAICLPTFPFEPAGGYPPLGFLPFSTLVNAVIINLVTPVGIYLLNVYRGNFAPFPYRFLGFPVEGATIERSFGFVMEEIREEDGVINRRFLSIREAIGGIIRGEGRVYTKDLRRFPDKFEKELELYRKSGNVWISYGVPFIVPIAVGTILALAFGDILFILMRIIAGV